MFVCLWTQTKGSEQKRETEMGPYPCDIHDLDSSELTRLDMTSLKRKKRQKRGNITHQQHTNIRVSLLNRWQWALSMTEEKVDVSLSGRRHHYATPFLERLKRTQKPVWTILACTILCVRACVLQCHQMTTLFGLEEPSKALRKLDRSTAMEEPEECGNENHCPRFPPIPSCLPVKICTSPDLHFITRETDAADTDHLRTQRVSWFRTIAEAASSEWLNYPVCAFQDELCTLHLLTKHTPTALIRSRGDVSARRGGKDWKKVGKRMTWGERVLHWVPSVLINNFNCYWKVIKSSETWRQPHG